jgi:hypothetical protein
VRVAAGLGGNHNGNTARLYSAKLLNYWSGREDSNLRPLPPENPRLPINGGFSRFSLALTAEQAVNRRGLRQLKRQQT